MSLNDPIQSLFLKGNAHDLRLRTNYPQSIESYSKISGLANLALGKSYKVLDGSNVYYVNREDLIKALGIVGPNVTDAMIEIELKWQRMLPNILEYLDVSNAQQLIEIPGAKEYLRGLTGGTPDSGLKPFVQNFVQKLTQLLPPEREKLFKLLLKMHFKAENIPEDAIITPLYPFINQVMGLPDANKKISLIWLFLDGVGNREAHDEALSSALIEFNRLLNEKLNEVFENPYMSPNARSVWSDIYFSNEGFQKIANILVDSHPGLLCYNIDRFTLSQEQKNAIAWKLAETEPGKLCWNIERFTLSREQKNAIAWKLAETVPHELCYNIDRFTLSREQKNAIAWKLAEIAPYDLIENIKKFTLSQEQNNAIAWKLAQKKPYTLSENIKKFTLSEEQKNAIAWKLAETVPNALFYDIDRFSLSEEQKNAIAWKLAEIAPYDLSENIKKFTLSEEHRYLLALKLIKTNPLYFKDDSISMSLNESNRFACKIFVMVIMLNEDSLLKSKELERSFGQHEEIKGLLKSLEENIIPEVPWLRKYLDNKTPFVQQNVLKWFYKVQILYKLYEGISGVLESTVLEQIIKCSAGNRYLMTKKLLELHLPHQAEALQMWQQLEDKAKNAVHAQIPSVLLAYFPPEITPTCLSILEKIKSKSEREFLRQGANQALLIATLHQLSESSLSSELKKRLLEGLFEVPLDQRKEVWRLVTDLINLGGGHEITVPLSSEGLKGSLERFFNKKFQIQVKGFYNKFVNTIGVWRNKEALMTWAGGLDRLAWNDKATAHRFFQDFMRYVLEGDFSDQRMALENPHLETIFRDRSDLKKAWVEQVSLAAEEMAVQKSELKEEEPGERVKRLFATQFFIDRHLGGAEQEMKYPHLTQYLSHPQEGAASIQTISAKIADLEAKVQEGLSMKARNQALAKLKEGDDYKSLQIERAALELLLNEEPNLIKEKTEALIKLLPPNNEFRHDLSGLLHEQSTNESVYTVLDSDHPNDFLLMGTEVEGSCQRVNGDPSKNCCILGYALDAKHRLALVKDAEGRIVARSVLRLLIDSEGSPVLFQERVYVANPDPQLPALIKKIAMKKAESLGIPLLVSPRDFSHVRSEPYGRTISAGGKPVPFEYVDALGGRQPEAYEILDTRRVEE